MLVSAQERQPLSPAVRRHAVAAVMDPAGLVIVLTTLTALGLRAYYLSQVIGTAPGLAVGPVLTAAAGLVCVPLMGRLTRHRGAFATLVACGVLAVYPDGLRADRTVLAEPWLVLFCLAGAVAVFRRDRLAAGRRLVAGGVAFGFAVVFAVAAPRGFLPSLFGTQVGPRSGAGRVPVPGHLLATSLTLGYDQAAWTMTVILAALTVGAPVVLNLLTSQPPSPLDWFAMGCTALVVALFLCPGQFHGHIAAFLVPFLGVAIALPFSRLLTLRLTRRPLRGPPPRHPVRAAATAGSVIILALLAFTQLLR